MDTFSLYEDTSWAEILGRLSSDLDLATTARETKAFIRSRGVRDPATLLRLALAYGAGGLSPRRTVAWAEAANVARISDVSLLDRLRNAKDWSELLWRTKLERLAPPVPLPGLDLSVRLIDATSISRPGSTGTDWRLHMDYRPLEGRFGGAVLSDGRTSEGFHHFTAGPGELVVGDRGYAKAKGLQAIHEAGGHFLVRIGWRSLVLLDDHGETIDIIGQLGTLPPNELTTLDVRLGSDTRTRRPLFPARLILVPLSEDARRQARKKALRKANRNGRNTSPLGEISAGWMMLLTSLDHDRATADQLVSLYR
jgi:hypothetical protein